MERPFNPEQMERISPEFKVPPNSGAPDDAADLIDYEGFASSDLGADDGQPTGPGPTVVADNVIIEPVHDDRQSRSIGYIAIMGAADHDVETPAAAQSDRQGAMDERSSATDKLASPYCSVKDGPLARAVQQRIDRHCPQGENTIVYRDGDRTEALRFENTCGLAAGAQGLSDALGRPVSEQSVVERAATAPELRGSCEVPGPSTSPEDWGATNEAGRERVFRSFGADAYSGHRWDVEQLAATVERGDSVLATVNTGDLWPASTPVEREQREMASDGGPDHVVYVIGTQRDTSGKLTGFAVNDTGMIGDDGAGVVHDVDTLARAWEQRGGTVNVICKERRQ